MFCHDSDPSGEECLDTVQSIAPEYRGKFIFVTVSHQELHLYHTFGIKIGTTHPQIVVLNVTDEHELQKYVLDSEAFKLMDSSASDNSIKQSAKKDTLTKENLRQFLGMYMDGMLLPFYRSEENDKSSKKSGETVADEETSSSEGVDGETEAERAERQDLLPVRVTSLTLKEKVIDNTESVLFFITAPW